MVAETAACRGAGVPTVPLAGARFCRGLRCAGELFCQAGDAFLEAKVMAKPSTSEPSRTGENLRICQLYAARMAQVSGNPASRDTPAAKMPVAKISPDSSL